MATPTLQPEGTFAPGIVGFVRIPTADDPNKVFALGSQGRPVADPADLATLVNQPGADPFSFVQDVLPQEALSVAVTGFAVGGKPFVPPQAPPVAKQAAEDTTQPAPQVTPQVVPEVEGAPQVVAPSGIAAQILVGERAMVGNKQFLRTAGGFRFIPTLAELTRLEDTGQVRGGFTQASEAQLGTLGMALTLQEIDAGVAGGLGIQPTAPSEIPTFEDAIAQIKNLQNLTQFDFSDIQSQINSLGERFGNIANISAETILQEELARRGIGQQTEILNELDSVILQQTRELRNLPENIQRSLEDIGVTQSQLNRLIAKETKPKAEVLRDLLEQRNIAEKEINRALSFASKFADTRIEDRAFKLSILKLELNTLTGQFKDIKEEQRNLINDAIDLTQQALENELDIAKEGREQVTFQTEEVNGRLIRFGFDINGEVISRIDLGTATTTIKPTATERAINSAEANLSQSRDPDTGKLNFPDYLRIRSGTAISTDQFDKRFSIRFLSEGDQATLRTLNTPNLCSTEMLALGLC